VGERRARNPGAGVGLTPGRSVLCRPLEGLPEVRPGDDLAALLAAAAPGDLVAGDVLVVSHKVVSKAEGRVRRLAEIEPGERARELASEHEKDPRLVQAVLDESAELLRARDGVFVCVTPHGLVCANAGVDRSNTGRGGELVLLPEDPDASARRLRAGLALARGLRPAVIVADSFGRAWRLGQTDVAIGVAGMTPLDDWRGRRDAYGRDLRVTQIAIADAAAGAADLARTKDSGEPAVLVRGLERFVTEDDGPGAAALRRPAAQDLFR
jgi:coenzyme F420-0:L-glutamate ligase/coenzyme F420-1:gamma-L-glutamate ligase